MRVVPSLQRPPRHLNRVCADFIGRLQVPRFLLILSACYLTTGILPRSTVPFSYLSSAQRLVVSHVPSVPFPSAIRLLLVVVARPLSPHRKQRHSRLIDARSVSCTALHRCLTFPRVLNKSYTSSSVGVSLSEQKSSVCIYRKRSNVCVDNTISD